MATETDYLDSDSPVSMMSEISGMLAMQYGFSALDMMSQARKSGRLFVPWTGLVSGGQGLGINMVGKKFGGLVARGSGHKGISKSGAMLMGASRLASATNAYFLATDPIWFGIRFLGNPLMLAAGAAWFGGGAVLNNAAQALERNRYVRMAVPFEDTEQSYTSRQRAVRAISESHLQARSAIGNEAQLFHR